MSTFADFVFPFLTPAEIYRQLTEGPGAGDLLFAQQQADREWAEEEGRADLVKELADVISSGWQGEAGANAYGSALPLRDRMLVNAAKLEQSQDLLRRQIDSFTTARNSVQPVSDPPENPIDEAFPFDVDYDKVVTEYQSSAQHNMVVYQQYDGASSYNETNMPQEFDAGGRRGGDVSMKSQADTIEVAEPRPGGGDPGPGAGGPPGGDSGGPGSSGYPGGSGFPGSSPGPSGPAAHRPDPGGTSSQGGQTTPNEFQPVPEGRPSSPSPGFSYPLPGQASPVSAGPGGFVGEAPFGGGGGSGAGGFGPRGGGGGAGGGAGAPGAVRGPGGAVGAGALAAEEAAARRAGQAVAGARPGMGPVGAPVGAGRGKDDEDTEHERKVLIEADAEDTFGSDVLTAPQVIGDDEYED